MQPAKGQHKRIAFALVLAIGVAVIASSAFGQTGRAGVRAARPSPSPAATQVPCMPQHCMLNPSSKTSTIHVQPIETTSPSFNVPASSNPGTGMLHSDKGSGEGSCQGYHAKDPEFLQFYIAQTDRKNVTYQVTDTVKNADAKKLQFCLAATFGFKTFSGDQARPFQLPNGLAGHAGLVPRCKLPPTPPCLVSKTQAPAPHSQDAMLMVLIPAVGDPWGRA